MDQKRIGKFIAESRKKQGLTQEELAEKLGVNNRTISRWENGINLPDVSLFKPLCDELNISINEFLSGEKLGDEEFSKKFEENILNTIDYTDKKIKKTKNIFKFVVSFILVVVGTLITLFCIDVDRMRNNKEVVFSTWGFNYASVIDLRYEEIQLAITDFLIEKNENSSKHYDSEKWFVAFKTYLIDEYGNDFYNVYAWSLEESYYLENDEIRLGSGSSIPHKFVVEKKDGEFVVVDYYIPRDGSLYVKDMKEIFPYGVRRDMDKVHEDGTIERLKIEIEQQVNLYFHK